ncbi:Peptidoglycan-binding Lysin subgroup [Penicillium cf. griseofulvum]|nr:Peptidoglycan-binding Lysin subgroup [Penicillium cf. griseofulvum]
MKPPKELLILVWLEILALAQIVEAQSPPHKLHVWAECKTIEVQLGNGCAELADRCKISGADLAKYNPAKDFCGTLKEGQIICCTAGDLPDLTPKPGEDGSCYVYTSKKDDNCAAIAAKNQITKKDIESFNKHTWGWAGCDRLKEKQRICLSKGDPPMPAALDNAICGPQVNGTKRPTNGTDIAGLNPCPLNVCCNIWGQCGITKDFCVKDLAETGAPGTSKTQNGCVASCGLDVVNNDDPPASWAHVAYYEAFNKDRPCLHMDVTDIDTTKFTHIHFAFANITEDFQVDVSDSKEQFDKMKGMSGIKRIISFGGWAFSTAAPTYTIFRDGVTEEQREVFANAVVAFVKDNKLDGVDFDWEYPAAPDIPGVPAGDKKDGQRYLEFLKVVKSRLPDQSVSIAAPASYWYLRGFPIREISEVVDYIIYMTYDLHGQWDYGKEWTTPGCTEGNCLRSHVNLTETTESLAMITKAGVSSKKIFAGIASYGRSFHMSDAGCTGPDCHYTGTGEVSDAAKGECTNTGGYIASAEIRDIIRQGQLSKRKVDTWHDRASNSDIVVYDDVEWIAWLADKTKASRIEYYKRLNLGGVSDWAVDLDGGGGLIQYKSPDNATVIPFPATTPAPTETFTIGGPVVSQIQSLKNNGDQNQPKGPGAEECETCDLARVITSTCCGIRGGVQNPLEISPNIPLPRGLILPTGFRPNQQIVDATSATWGAGSTLPWEIVIPMGYEFPFPFEIPPGLGLSDTSSGIYADNDDDRTNGVLYIVDDFWDGPHTVSCSYPCTLLFPPITTTTTWTPSTFVTTSGSESATITPPVQTTEKIRIYKHTVTSDKDSEPTKIIGPVPAPDPLCVEVTVPVLGTIRFGLCPPQIKPYPPSIPKVTVKPVPPGKKPGPINIENKPSDDQKEEEEEEDEDRDEEEGATCILLPPTEGGDIQGPDSGLINDEPDIPSYGDTDDGQDNRPTNAGTGSPTTGTVSYTITNKPIVPTVTETVVITVPAPAPTPPVDEPEPEPEPPSPNPDTEEKTCYGYPNREVYGGTVQDALDGFCEWADGTTIAENGFLQVKAPGDVLSNVIVGVAGKNNCKFAIEEKDCKRILNKVVGCKAYSASLLRIGGEVESNCAVWSLDPIENLMGECMDIPVLKQWCQLVQFFAGG